MSTTRHADAQFQQPFPAGTDLTHLMEEFRRTPRGARMMRNVTRVVAGDLSKSGLPTHWIQTAPEAPTEAPPDMPVMVDSGTYDHKPSNEETKAISCRIMRGSRNLSQPELAKAVTTGHTVIGAGLAPSYDPKKGKLRNTPKEAELLSKNLWMIDVDNETEGYTLQELMTSLRAAGLAPFLVYETMRSTPEKPRFRVCIQSDEAVKYISHQTRITAGLVKVLTGKVPDVDDSCTNHNRLFYPGRRVAWMAPRATTPLAVLEALAVREEEMPRKPKSVGTRKVEGSFITGMGTRYATPESLAIAAGDVEELRRLIRNRLDGLGGFDETDKGPINLSLICLLKGSQKDAASIPVPMADQIPLFDSLPMDIILGLPGNNSLFRCILHDDGNPSAHITPLEDGRGTYWRYKCFGCMAPGIAYSITSVIEKLQGRGRYQAFKFLRSLLRIEDSQWMKDRKDELDYYTEMFRTGLDRENPALASILRQTNSLSVMVVLLQEARRHLFDCPNGRDIPFFIGLRELGRELRSMGATGVSPAVVMKKVNYLVELGLVSKLADTDVPWKMLKDARRLRDAQEYAYHKTFYGIPDLSADRLDGAVGIHVSNRQIGSRRGSASREAILMAHGEERANQIYVQDQNRTLTDDTLLFYDRYRAAAGALLAAQGWMTEHQLLDQISGYREWKLRDLSGKCLPKLLQDMDLRFVPITKDIRTLHRIPDSIPYGSKAIIPT